MCYFIVTFPWPSIQLYCIDHMTKLASVTIYDQNINSFARDLIPFAWIIISFSRDLISFERIIISFSQDVIPFARIINSFSRYLIQFARIINPFSRDLIPFTRIINPFSRHLITFARIINSFSRVLLPFARIIMEAYILLHLLHKSARKLLNVSEINGLSEIILRLLEKNVIRQ